MNKYINNLIKKKIDTEKGIQYLLCCFGISLIITNPFLVDNFLLKASCFFKNLQFSELSSQYSVENPANKVQDLTKISLNLNNGKDKIDNFLKLSIFSKKDDSKNKVVIKDHNQDFEVETSFATVGELLQNLDIKLTANQKEEINLFQPIEDGMEIKITSDVVERGYASWYGPGFHGRTTANGEKYDMYALTAAHKKLPFNSLIRVINRINGKSCVVRINDRGPYVSGRIIDLTYTAKQLLGIDGVAMVDLEILE